MLLSSLEVNYINVCQRWFFVVRPTSLSKDSADCHDKTSCIIFFLLGSDVITTLKNVVVVKGAVPLETAALNRRWRSYAMYLFLVVCSMYAYFVVAVETDTNRQLL